ncbi:MAG TPA: hypothetical protein EYP08_06635 [Pyrodictiaceae archaeon]|nr:hypothetical protein [Pyrodictiaceae archaeon]HIP85549.1 hypothetical protein [Pyrodictium sp.]HIQ55908.1 hypothetical protein [Pyrodictium sp.]
MKGVISNIISKAHHLVALIIFVSGFVLGGTATTTLTPKIATPTSVVTYTLTTTFYLERTTTTTTTVTETYTMTTGSSSSTHTITVTKTITIRPETITPPRIVSLHYSSASANADAKYMVSTNKNETLVHAELLVNIFGIALVEIKADMAVNETAVLTLLKFRYSLPIPFTPPKAYNVTVHLLEDEKVLGIAKGVVKIEVEKGSGIGVLPIAWISGKPELGKIDRIVINLSPQR